MNSEDGKRRSKRRVGGAEKAGIENEGEKVEERRYSGGEEIRSLYSFPDMEA